MSRQELRDAGAPWLDLALEDQLEEAAQRFCIEPCLRQEANREVVGLALEIAVVAEHAEGRRNACRNAREIPPREPRERGRPRGLEELPHAMPVDDMAELMA